MDKDIAQWQLERPELNYIQTGSKVNWKWAVIDKKKAELEDLRNGYIDKDYSKKRRAIFDYLDKLGYKMDRRIS